MKDRVFRAVLSLAGLAAVKWRWLPQGLYCFNYHRIGDPKKTDYDHDVFSCDEQRFERHVALIRERFELVNIERLLSDARRRGRAADRPLALITFDDGYVDNYLSAFPILRRHGGTAVFFLPTAFIGTKRVPWWDEIAWVLRKAARPSVQFPDRGEVFALSRAKIDLSIRGVLERVKTRVAIPLERQIEEIRDLCGVSEACPVEEAPLFMNWDQVREMHAAGMDFGGHSHSHDLLSGLSAAAQQQELARSKEILEHELGAPVVSMAYPVGSTTSYTRDTVELAEAVGYKLAFNYVRQVNALPLERPFEVNRLGVFGHMDNSGLRALACFPRYFA